MSSVENTDNAIQSASIPMVALGTSSTIITIVAWLVVGKYFYLMVSDMMYSFTVFKFFKKRDFIYL